MPRALFRVLGPVLLLIGVVALFRFLPMAGWVQSLQKQVESLGPAAAALYPLLCATCNLLLLPGGILSIGAGFFFGLWWGFALALAGNLLGASLAFLIGRGIGRNWIARKLLTLPKWAALDHAIARDGAKIIFLSQLNPLFPTSLLNYLYGVTQIRFWPCMAWIALGQAPGLFLYAYIGTLGQHGLKLFEGDAHPKPLEYVVWLGGFALTAFTAISLGRIALRLLKEIEKNALLKDPPTFDTSGNARNLNP